MKAELLRWVSLQVLEWHDLRYESCLASVWPELVSRPLLNHRTSRWYLVLDRLERSESVALLLSQGKMGELEARILNGEFTLMEELGARVVIPAAVVREGYLQSKLLLGLTSPYTGNIELTSQSRIDGEELAWKLQRRIELTYPGGIMDEDEVSSLYWERGENLSWLLKELNAQNHTEGVKASSPITEAEDVEMDIQGYLFSSLGSVASCIAPEMMKSQYILQFQEVRTKQEQKQEQREEDGSEPQNPRTSEKREQYELSVWKEAVWRLILHVLHNEEDDEEEPTNEDEVVMNNLPQIVLLLKPTLIDTLTSILECEEEHLVPEVVVLMQRGTFAHLCGMREIREKLQQILEVVRWNYFRR